MGRLQEKPEVNQVFVSNEVVEALERDLSRDEAASISQAIDRLQQNPLEGSVLVGTRDSADVVRVMPAGNLRLIYRIDDDEGAIRVLNLYRRSAS